MRFLADMGVAQSVVRELRAQGHDALHLLEEGLERLPDRDVLAKAAAEGRVLLTFDLDFADIVALSKARLPSVVLFRLRDARVERVKARLSRCLGELAPVLEEGAVLVVEDARFRVRRLPISVRETNPWTFGPRS